MAHLWFTDQEGRWTLHSLQGNCTWAARSPDQYLLPFSRESAAENVSFLEVRRQGAPSVWALLASASAPVRINGADFALGIRALQDKDDILIAGQRLFFSTEELARIEPFAGADQAAFCPRCKQEIQRGHDAVKCPRCRAWHHQTEKFPCWNYDARCALCQDQPTELNGGYTWTPEEL